MSNCGGTSGMRWREPTPGPKKNMVVAVAMEKLQRLHERGGRSYRSLYIRCGLVRSSAQRWQTHLRRGLPAVLRRGLPEPRPADAAALSQDIAKLRYGTHRCRGIGGLYGKWAGVFSQAEISDRIQAERRRRNREQRGEWQRLCWLAPGAVWAMDPGELYGMLWNLVSDMASRFRFDIQINAHLPAEVILRQLQGLFERFGPPLVLKRDNGSNLTNPLIDKLLDAFGVIALTSPPYYPRYNGAIEYGQRELKTVATVMHDVIQMPLHEALVLAPGMINAQPRPCLTGSTAHAVLHTALPTLRQTYTLTRRKEIKRWIEARTETIVKNMATDDCHAHAAAKRLATETWMRDEGLVIPVPQPTCVLPHYR